MEQWNNVELNNLRKKSYTLNHEYDAATGVVKKLNNNETPGTAAGSNGETTNANNSEVLSPGSSIKPKVKLADVEAMAQRLYGITISAVKELISYDDRNYLIREDPNIKNPLIVPHSPHGYVLKVLNALDSKKTDFVDAQNELLLYLVKQDIQCPRPIINVNGKYFSVEHLHGGEHVVRLLEFVPGKIFHQVELTNYLLYQSGEYLAKVDRALKNFSHAAYETHKTLWMLQSVPQLRDFVYVLQDHTRKALVEEIIEAFELEVLSKLGELEQQIIHGDYNEQNIIVATPPVEPGEQPHLLDYRVVGLIDFGDTNKSPVIFEIGIAMTYMMLQAKSLDSAGIFLAGYTSERAITAEEKQLLKYCVAARLAQSLVLGAYTHTQDPTNQYVLVTQEQGWKLIEELWRESFNKVDEIWQQTADKYLTSSLK